MMCLEGCGTLYPPMLSLKSTTGQCLPHLYMAMVALARRQLSHLFAPICTCQPCGAHLNQLHHHFRIVSGAFQLNLDHWQNTCHASGPMYTKQADAEQWWYVSFKPHVSKTKKRICLRKSSVFKDTGGPTQSYCFRYEKSNAWNRTCVLPRFTFFHTSLTSSQSCDLTEQHNVEVWHTVSVILEYMEKVACLHHVQDTNCGI